MVSGVMLTSVAERAISKANPPRPLAETGRGHKGVSQEHAFIEPSVIRHIRAAHSKLTDDQFEARTVPKPHRIDRFAYASENSSSSGVGMRK